MLMQDGHPSVRRTLALVGMACVLMGCSDQGADQASNPVPPPRPTPTVANARIDGALAYALDGDIYVAEWDGSNPAKIAEGLPEAGEWEGDTLLEERCGPGRLGQDEYFAEGPIWSPDGRYLAYRHHDCGGPRYAWEDVVISDRAGKVISSFHSAGWGIAWSSDSLRVAVWERLGATIGVYGVDGVRQTLLEVPPGSSTMGESDPMWSPDGESILLPGGLAIPVDGGTPRLLPWWEPNGSRWSCSPDGRRVALAVDGSFFIAEADGSNPREVFGLLPSSVVWSPAGDRIAFTSTGPGSARLRVLDVATGTTSPVMEFGRPGSHSLIDFSPEGDRILFSKWERNRGEWTTSLWSVNVDGSDMRLLVAGTASGDWIT